MKRQGFFSICDLNLGDGMADISIKLYTAKVWLL